MTRARVCARVRARRSDEEDGFDEAVRVLAAEAHASNADGAGAPQSRGGVVELRKVREKCACSLQSARGSGAPWTPERPRALTPPPPTSTQPTSPQLPTPKRRCAMRRPAPTPSRRATQHTNANNDAGGDDARHTDPIRTGRAPPA